MMLKEFASWKRVSKEVARRTAQSIMLLGCLPEQEGAWLHVEDDFIQDPTVTLSFEPEFLMDDKSYIAVSLSSPAHVYLYCNSTSKTVQACTLSVKRTAALKCTDPTRYVSRPRNF